MQPDIEPFFLRTDVGRRFCTYYCASESAVCRDFALVHIHAFAEEMNKARRMIALQSRQLAAAGYPVLTVDLFGCGDSDGDFSEARWEIWKNDVVAAVRWLRNRTARPIGLWGLRLGASLAAQVAGEHVVPIERLLLWQPVISGDHYLNQFLRLKVAGSMLVGNAERPSTHALREMLNKARLTVEVGGYPVTPEFADGLIDLDMGRIPLNAAQVDWIEVSSGNVLSPTAERVISVWRGSGNTVTTAVVDGEPFWGTIEVTDCMNLVHETQRVLSSR